MLEFPSLKVHCKFTALKSQIKNITNVATLLRQTFSAKTMTSLI